MINRNFLVTRNSKDAALTKNKFKKYNFNVVTLPLSEVIILNTSLPNLDHVSAIIFTSKNAFKIKNYHFWKELNKKHPFLIIGKSFAELLTKNEIHNFYSFNSVEELINYLSKNFLNTNLFYFRGEKTSHDLKIELTQNVTEEICYKILYKDIQAQEIIDFISKNKITDILFFSYHNSINFLNILNNNIAFLKQYNIFCLSNKIAKIFINKELKQVFHPNNPNLDELLKTIEKHHS